MISAVKKASSSIYRLAYKICKLVGLISGLSKGCPSTCFFSVNLLATIWWSRWSPTVSHISIYIYASSGTYAPCASSL